MVPKAPVPDQDEMVPWEYGYPAAQRSEPGVDLYQYNPI